jgi:hypothetical protein
MPLTPRERDVIYRTIRYANKCGETFVKAENIARELGFYDKSHVHAAWRKAVAVGLMTGAYSKQFERRGKRFRRFLMPNHWRPEQVHRVKECPNRTLNQKGKRVSKSDTGQCPNRTPGSVQIGHSPSIEDLSPQLTLPFNDNGQASSSPVAAPDEDGPPIDQGPELEDLRRRLAGCGVSVATAEMLIADPARRARLPEALAVAERNLRKIDNPNGFFRGMTDGRAIDPPPQNPAANLDGGTTKRGAPSRARVGDGTPEGYGPNVQPRRFFVPSKRAADDIAAQRACADRELSAMSLDEVWALAAELTKFDEATQPENYSRGPHSLRTALGRLFERGGDPRTLARFVQTYADAKLREPVG